MYGQDTKNWEVLSYMTVCRYLPPWLSGLAISGRGAVKAWLEPTNDSVHVGDRSNSLQHFTSKTKPMNSTRHLIHNFL